MIVQVSPEAVCNSCHPPALRASRAAATASVNVRPPCISPTIVPGGSALASFALATCRIIRDVSTPTPKARRWVERAEDSRLDIPHCLWSALKMEVSQFCERADQSVGRSGSSKTFCSVGPSCCVSQILPLAVQGLLRDAGELSRDLLRQQNQSTTPVAVAVLGMLSDFADSSWQSVMPAAALIPPSPSVPSDAVRGRITPV